MDSPKVCHHLDHIEIERIDLTGAMGPVYARYKADSLYSSHKHYIMILDSHTVFRPNWDTVLIDLWKSIENEYAIVTHYPWGAEHLERRTKCFDDPNCDDKWSYHVCGSYFEGKNHMPRDANGCHIKDVVKPVLTPFLQLVFHSHGHIYETWFLGIHIKSMFFGERNLGTGLDVYTWL
eukprot:UN27335